MVVLSFKPLQFKILKFIYNFPIVGYPGRVKTYKICIYKKTSYIKKQRVF